MNNMNHTDNLERNVTVAPFWRGHVHISPDEYAQLQQVFSADNPNALQGLIEILPKLSAVVRHNVQRIMTAALVAEHEHGKVLLVEGCRANAIEKHDEDEHAANKRHLTGSHVGMLIAKALRKIGVIPQDVPFEHASKSRCTDWEADVLLEKVPSGGTLIGIAGPYNEPSEQRASDVVRRLAPAETDALVFSPRRALSTFNIRPTPEQRAVLQAASLTDEERAEGEENERKATRIQSISDMFARIGLRGKYSLISILARILPSRQDKKRRD